MRKKEAIKGNPKQQDVLSLINERQATMSRGHNDLRYKAQFDAARGTSLPDVH